MNEQINVTLILKVYSHPSQLKNNRNTSIVCEREIVCNSVYIGLYIYKTILIKMTIFD